jgi:hypothetical protein
MALSRHRNLYTVKQRPALQTLIGNIGQDAIDGLAFVPDATPLPAALPLFATGLGALGLLGWRRKRKARALPR